MNYIVFDLEWNQSCLLYTSEMKLKKLTPLAAIILMTLSLLVIVRKSEEPLSVETILKYTPEMCIRDRPLMNSRQI